VRARQGICRHMSEASKRVHEISINEGPPLPVHMASLVFAQLGTFVDKTRKYVNAATNGIDVMASQVFIVALGNSTYP